MRIIQRYGVDFAGESEGIVVVIDVIRAFSTCAWAFYRGAEQIILVARAEEAFELQRCYPAYLILGEEGGRKIEGFDFGNSPEAVSQLDLSGRTLVLRSSSGTQGVTRASKAQYILGGSLLVARHTVDWIRAQNPELVTFLAMGSSRGPDKEEDLACSDYMAALLRGESIDENRIINRVQESPAALQCLDPAVTWKSPLDLELLLQINRFSFAMIVEKKDGLHVLKPRK